MRNYFLTISTILVFSFAAQAQSLLGSSCLPSTPNNALASQTWASIDSLNLSTQISQPTFAGLSCKDLKAIDDSYYLVSLSIVPALRAFAQSSAVQGALAAELAGLGIVAGSPAVLGVTVIGGFGIVTLNILLKMSLEECERQDRENLKNQIIQELETRYGVQTPSQPTLQITP